MSESDPTAEVRAWAQRFEAAWEITPLVEVVKGEGRRQTGFELRIYAQIEHADPHAGGSIHSRIRQIAERVIPHEHTPLEFEVGEYDSEEYLRRETGYAAEVMVPIVVTYADPDHPPKPDVVHLVMTAIETRLGELGVRPKAWDARR
jgi:hypothetical protein